MEPLPKGLFPISSVCKTGRAVWYSLILLCGVSLGAPALALADSSVGQLPGAASGISGNGSTVAGYYTNADGRPEAYYWTAAGGMQSIGFLPGAYNNSITTGISTDGTTIVGYSSINGGLNFAYRWTQAGGMQAIGLAPNSYSNMAMGVNADGSVVVGYSSTYSNTHEAFRWTEAGGTQGLGFLAGAAANYSYAQAVSGDGLVVVGYATNSTYNTEAFRWTQTDGMQGLGTLNGYSSNASATNMDGSVIIGSSGSQAFRWTQAGGMQGLGFTAGDNFSSATAMSADSSVIVGNGYDSNLVARAFRWTESTGMVSLQQVLADRNVDVSQWRLQSASGVSGNGNIVVGNGTYNGTQTAYIANVATGGVTTPQDLGASLNTVVQSTQQASMVATQFLPQNIFVAQHIQQISTPVHVSGGSPAAFSDLSPAAGDFVASPLSVFMMGSYGTGQNNNSGSNQLNGTAGVNLKVSPELNVGLGVVGSGARNDLAFGGKSKLDALGGMALASYEPKDTPLRVYGTAYVAHVNVDTTRGYLNGGGMDYSQGETEGVSYGTAVRVGWEKRAGNTTVMPYVEGRYSKTNLDAYNETGGAFATNYSEQDNESITTRVGVELTHPLTDRTQVLFRPAWGHRISGNGAAFDANTGGLTQTLQGNAGDRDWAEATVGAAWQATDRLSLSTELTGRTGNTSESQATLMVGAFIKF